MSLLSLASAASADDGIGGDLGTVHGIEKLSGTATIALFAGSGSTGDGHVYDVRPQCGDDQGGQAICYGPQECNADDGEPGTAMDLYRDGEVYGETCLSDTQAGNLGVITPGLVIREFERLTWPRSDLTIEPPGQRTAVNLPTYFATDNTTATTQSVVLIGQDVDIEATPTAYLYRFGNGQQLQTTSPGGPYPTGDVVHEYRTKGTTNAAVDTVYTGRYRVNDGPWRGIDQSVTVPGAPVALEVVEVRPTLVAPARP